MLNVDFFQPYKHIQYSLGAIYLTVLNIPRDMRHKTENVILVGLIPGPHEPSHDLNSYLEPLVQDLLRLWKGLTSCSALTEVIVADKSSENCSVSSCGS